MSNVEDFNALVNRALMSPEHTNMRPVIEKELLHYDILYALDKENLLDNLTFQGGTLLRLCYGAPRFSEDLDFAGGKNFTRANLGDIRHCIETYIAARYGLEVSVKEPKQLLLEEGNDEITVDKWQVSITTAPAQRDLPKQKIKIEIINVPAYSRQPRPLKKNYDFLPDGYSDLFVIGETLDEVYADKIIAFVNCQKYIRYRDIWDLRWLKQQGATLNKEFVCHKIEDYKIPNYLEKLNLLMPNLKNLIHSDGFKNQMSRFIPMDTQKRTLQQEKFYDVLTFELAELFNQVKDTLD
jgi:predicted nucleotidyltransferase component of viral defense system